jgi:hypothetical protein
MKRKISDQQLEEALSLFRDSVHEFRPTGERRPSPSFPAWRLALAVFAMITILVAGVPIYFQHQNDLANAAAQQAELAAKQDDALLREVESDVSLSVPPTMQKLELLMVSDSTTPDTERSK